MDILSKVYRRVIPIAGLTVFACAGVAGSSTIPESYNAAVKLIADGQASEAIQILLPLEKKDAGATREQLALIRLALGKAYLRESNAMGAREALAHVGDALDDTPQAAALAALRADAERLTGAREEAERWYAMAAKRAGTGSLVRYSDARLSELKGMAAEHAEDYSNAASLYLSAGEVLLGLGAEDPSYYVDARALFELVAKGSVKAAPGKGWRGEPTARAVFMLGEVEREQGNFAEAIAYYQRTFVSWLKYPQWPARAYLRAAECMDKLGKRQFAIRHLQEMIRKADKFGQLPEFQQAKKQLRAWTAETELKTGADR